MVTSKASRLRSTRNISRYQQHPYDQPGADGQQRAEDGLQGQHRGDVALLQAQNVVQAQLLFAPLDQKAVGVVEEDER